MLKSPGTLTRTRKGSMPLPALSSIASRSWFSGPGLADLTAIADFGNDRYAKTAVPDAGIATATAAELCVKRSCNFAEWFAFTCSSTAARTYLDMTGTLRNDLAVDAPRLTWQNARRQLLLEDAATNLVLNSATCATQGITVTASLHILSFTGTGSIAYSGAASGSLAGTDSNTRVSTSVTTAAGTLTLTPSGDVRMVQLELAILSAYIPTAASAVTRAIETARLSPMLEAILQRSAASIIVRGQNMRRATGRILGQATSTVLMRSSSGLTTVSHSNPSDLFTTAGANLSSNSFGLGLSWDAAGRSVTRNGTAVATDALAYVPSAQTYLARSSNVSNYGNGCWDMVMVSPYRVSDARLTELAVTA